MLQCIHFLQCDVSCFSYARLQNDARSRKNRPFEVTFETFPEMKRLRLCQSVLFSVLLPSSLIVGLSGSAYSSQFNKTKDGKRKKAAREGLESISSDKPVSFSGRSLIRKWRARPTDASRLDNNFLLTKRQIEWEKEREKEREKHSAVGVSQSLVFAIIRTPPDSLANRLFSGGINWTAKRPFFSFFNDRHVRTPLHRGLLMARQVVFFLSFSFSFSFFLFKEPCWIGWRRERFSFYMNYAPPVAIKRESNGEVVDDHTDTKSRSSLLQSLKWQFMWMQHRDTDFLIDRVWD